jgi:hypothetical protein
MKSVINVSMIGVLSLALVACTSNAADPVPAADAAKSRPAPVVRKTTVPSGTQVRVALIDAVGTEKSSPGDEFTASLIEPIVIGGKTIVAKGTRVHGRVIDVEDSGRVKGRATISLTLTSITPGGKNISIDTDPFVAVAEATKKRDAAVIGGGAGVGAAIGAIAGGKKGAGIGALVGGGAGTGTVLATKGKELNYPPESRLTFTLSNPFEV